MKNQITDTVPAKNQQQVVVFSRNHLLGYHLSLSFGAAHLQTSLFHLSPSTVSYKIINPQVAQENYSPDRPLPTADYSIFIYPTVGDLSLIGRLTSIVKTNDSKFCFILNYRDLRLLDTIRSRLPPGLNYRFIILTDPYGPYFTGQADPLSSLVLESTQKKNLTVTDSGKFKFYPTYIADLAPIILKTVFTSGTDHQTFWLSTLEESKNIDVAYKLINLSAELLNTDLELAVTDSSASPFDIDTDAIALSQSQLNWEPTTDLEDGLRHTLEVAVPQLEELPKLKPHIDLAKLPPIERKVRRFFNPKAWLIIVFLSLIAALITLPIILFVINSYLGVNHLSRAVNDLQQGSTVTSHSLALQATDAFGRSRVLLQSGNPVVWLIPATTLSQTDKLLDALTRLSVVIATGSNTVGQAEELYQIILGGSTASFSGTVSSLKGSLDSLYSELSLVRVALDKVDLGTNLEFFNKLTSAKAQLPEMLSQLQLGLSSLDLLPAMIGTPTPQTYLVLLQNSAELRPTGGFISSYALVTFQNGHIIDLKVNDVYSADGQLSGHVEPPSAIKKYLGESNWYLRDSNWYPSFPNTARQIEWFIGKELNREVHGVIALNLYSVKDLLQATGPISLASFNESINADNLFDRAQYRSEINFAPDANHKQDFMTSLFEKLLLEIKSGRVPLAKLTSVFDRSLRSRQILIMSNNEQVQASLDALNWTGAVKHQPCPSAFIGTDCTSSTFALIEANLGVNKTNFFLERQIKQSVNFENDGRLNFQVSIAYKNNSTSTAWPGGRYKTLTRFYSPLGTELISAKFNGADISFETITNIPDLGLTEMAFYYEVPISSVAQLDLVLLSSQIVATQRPSSSLSINWLKQSGTGDDPISISINYPTSITPTQMSLPAENPPQQLNLGTLLKGNLFYAVQFKKN